MKKTKIVCTLGPATDNKDVLRAMIKAGMNAARINFSHSTHEEQLKRINMFKEVRDEMGETVALLADTKGPEIRLGAFEAHEVELKANAPFTLTTEETIGNDRMAYVSFAGLPHDVTRGTRILLDDGLIELMVDSCTDTEINCTVINGGMVSANKGVNVPGIHLSLPFISSHDRADLRFIVENDFDFIATSFTRTAEDVRMIKDELDRLGDKSIQIIAKIENSDGVANIDEILNVSDGIMVARGDLGVEIPLEDIPVIQKKLIKKASLAGKQVITATQMLESMINNPRPTRAEITDVANAIYDGTSAIMLSGETAAGKYPIEAVKTMARIAERTERDINYKARFNNNPHNDLCNVTNAISYATCTAAHDLSAVCIITVTESGSTARMISKNRPSCQIVSCSTTPKVVRQLNMAWGILSLGIEEQTSTDSLFAQAVATAKDAGAVRDGDLVVITAGVPLGVSGTTNMMKVHVVGDPLEYGAKK